MVTKYELHMLMGARARYLGCLTVQLIRKAVWAFLMFLGVFGGVCVRRCLSNFTTAVKLVGTTGISGRGGLGSAVNMFYPPLNHLTTLIANSANSEPNKEKHKR